MRPGFIKTTIGVVLIVVILITIGYIAFIDTIMGPSFKVEVHGTVYYDAVNGWGFTFDGYDIKPDSYTALSIFDTDEITGVVVLHNNVGDTYRAETSIGSLNIVWDSKPITVSVRHMKQGVYHGEFIIYQVKYGAFGLFEESKTELFSVSLSNIEI